MVKLNMYQYGSFVNMLKTNKTLMPRERDAFLRDLREYAGYEFDTATVKKFIYSLINNTRDKKEYSLEDLKNILRDLDELK